MYDNDGHPIPNLPGSTVFPIDIEQAIERETVRLESPLEDEPTIADEDWYARIRAGEIGLELAEVTHIEVLPTLQELQDKPWHQDTYDYLPSDAGTE